MVGALAGLTGHGRSRRTSAASNRSSVDEARIDGPEDETTVVEPDQGNVLSHIISQLRPGADLSRVVLPTFILEPRSMLERITNFMAHPETLLPMSAIDDPVLRFVSVVKFYLSGWHIKPPGVKKPLNPILGETFTCYWEFPDNTRGYYISEQTSHHPPKSSYFYMAPEHHIRIDGCLKPRSKFLGNSAASLMEGIAVLRFLNRDGEKYFLTQPNMYARGILFGKMKYELGDHSFVRCPELGLSADIEFKTKGYFGGTYNAIGGTIKNDAGDILYELSGMWTGDMYLKDLHSHKQELLFSAVKSKPTPPIARSLDEQEDRESQKLWYATAEAVKARNHELATDEKTKIEDMQRDEAARRAEDGLEWRPRLFRPVKGGPGGPEEGEEDLDWILNASIDGDTPEKQTQQILAITPILKGQKSTDKNIIPPRRSSQTPSVTQVAAPQKHTSASVPEDDLIDFGQNDGTPAHPNSSQTSNAPLPQPPLQQNATKEHDTQETSSSRAQEGMEAMLKSTSTAKATTGPLLDFHEDMKTSVPPAGIPRIVREDTSEDEFVDAEE